MEPLSNEESINKKEKYTQSSMNLTTSASLNSPIPSMEAISRRTKTKEKRHLPANLDSNSNINSNSNSNTEEITMKQKKEVLLVEEAMKLQPTINIGMLGHVANGKSTLTRALSSVVTGKFQEELEKSMTIKLGYANCKIFKCRDPSCPRPWCYAAYPSSQMTEPTCSRFTCNSKMKLVQHISFVDAPGHHSLMTTMLSGAAVMDAAILVVAANEKCPCPQTTEHMIAAEIMGISKHMVVVQNKVDLLAHDKAACYEHSRQINEFLQGTLAEKAPIIPISAQKKIGIDVLCDVLVNKLVPPPRDLNASPVMPIIRSFDVNRPGQPIITITTAS